MKKMLICDENFEPDLEISFKMKYNFICLNFFFFGSAFYKIIKKERVSILIGRKILLWIRFVFVKLHGFIKKTSFRARVAKPMMYGRGIPYDLKGKPQKRCHYNWNHEFLTQLVLMDLNLERNCSFHQSLVRDICLSKSRASWGWFRIAGDAQLDNSEKSQLLQGRF